MRRILGVLLIAVLGLSLSGCGGNRGAKTSCPDFMKMAETQRHAVIAKMGYPLHSGPNDYWTDMASRDCAGQPSDTNVKDVMDGP